MSSTISTKHNLIRVATECSDRCLTCAKPKSAIRGTPRSLIAIFACRGTEKVLGRNIERTTYALQIAMDNWRGHSVKNMKSFGNTSNLRILSQAASGRCGRETYQLPVTDGGIMGLDVTDRIPILLPWTDHVSVSSHKFSCIQHKRHRLTDRDRH